ncbi:MAG: hypothetical protein RLZZ461_1683 [Planctomycetota bacterium]|jgi:hypothetical protein
MTIDQNLPIHDLLRMASGSWTQLDDLLRRVAQQPDTWLSDATNAVGLPADASILDLTITDLEAARDRLRANRPQLDESVALLANIIIITAGVTHDRLLTSASITEVEFAITALTTAMPTSWDPVLDRALTSPLFDRPHGRSVGRDAV